MWSVKHTGYQGVIKDTYQRICLRMPAHEFLDPEMWKKVEDLVSAYMLRHLFLEVDLKDSSLDYRHLEDQCSALRDLTLPEEKIVFTCEVANYERDNTAIKKVMMHIKPEVVLLKRCETRNKTLTMIKYLSIDTDDLAEEGKKETDEYNKEEENNNDNEENERGNENELGDKHHHHDHDHHHHHEEAVRTAAADVPGTISKVPVVRPVALGASSLVDEERQYVLDAHRGVIRAMCLGPVLFPNLQTCTIDLLHTRECNVYMTIDSFDDDHVRGLGKFTKKYKRPAPAILTKVLLELGAVVCIDRLLIDQECFYSDILRLVHPFTYLQVSE
jgi:hypothetical protein